MNLLRRYWLLILLALVAAMLGFVWARWRVEERAAQKETLPSLPKLSFPQIRGQSIPPTTTINFQTDILKRDRVSLFRISPLSFTNNQAIKIGEFLGFLVKPYINADVFSEKVYSWEQGGKSLSVGLNPASVSFWTNALEIKPPEEGVLPPLDIATKKIKQLLTDMGIGLAGIDLAVVSSRELLDGQLLEIRLTPIIEGGVVVTDVNPASSIINAAIQKDGRLFQFSLSGAFSNPIFSVSYPAKTAGVVAEKLPEEGKIVSIGEAVEAFPSLIPATITINAMTDALLFSREDPNSLYPVYALNGTASVPGQGEVQVLIYIPSIHSNYLK